MALVHLDFESQYCKFNQDVYIILPDKPRKVDAKDFYQKGKKYKVLWLLHGTFGSYSDWVRKSNIELYACEHNLMVVMPGVGNSDYEEWDSFGTGYDSGKYITEELMPLVYSWFPASDKREDNFIAGLSMGGSGATKLALAHPEKFEAAAILSSCPKNLGARRDELIDLFARKPSQLEGMNKRLYNRMHRFDSVDDFLTSPSNSWHTFNQKIHDKNLPRFFFSVGTEDFNWKDWNIFKELCEKEGFEAEWVIGPGEHEWRVWERDIQKALVFFGFTGEAEGNAF